MNAIFKATQLDLPFLMMLEQSSFESSRQFTKNMMMRSLESKHQSVFIMSVNDLHVGAIILRYYTSSWRIYSLAVLSEHRGMNYGKILVNYAIDLAKEHHINTMSLEVEAANIKLIAWYESFGFFLESEKKSYYGELKPAFRMVLQLTKKIVLSKKTLNLVVVDQPVDWLKDIPEITIVPALDFIQQDKYQNLKGYRIFNLCQSYEYQTMGYYVSLLAAARNQRVIPNVATIKDFSDLLVIELIADEIYVLVQKSLAHIRSIEFTLHVYFGQTSTQKYAKLAKALYKLFETPFLEFTFEKGREWHLKKVTPLSLSMIEPNDALRQAAHVFFNQRRFSITRFKDYTYDLAILIDPSEKVPPSCDIALSKFKRAAEKMGFYTEFITKDDIRRISEFDALFIRATTNVNDYTYQFSRHAYAEGLIVIDDPWSIVKCSNKLYLAESLKKAGILTPKTMLLSPTTDISDMIEMLGFPIVLKQPDSAFSLGVFKVTTESELQNQLSKLFQTSELIVAQAYVRSDYDWRIGVLDNTPLYACKYYMAKNHWQIINWQSKSERNQCGHVSTVTIDAVPKYIIDAAIKATRLMGDGLYGVDIKEIDHKAMVIEVNDNPSIEYHYEDLVLGDALYEAIMRNIYQRIETARNLKRKIA